MLEFTTLFVTKLMKTAIITYKQMLVGHFKKEYDDKSAACSAVVNHEHFISQEI